MSRDLPRTETSSVDDRIDEQCDAFESAWRDGSRPNIARFIGPEDGPYRNKLFGELLLVELDYRRSLGEHPTQEFYLREFPEYASQIDSISFQYGPAGFSTCVESRENVRVVDYQPGQRIDHFELRERLGEGAMGQAWKAWDTHLRRNVTIKLPRSHFPSENDLRRLLRESEVAAQLSHPQVTSIHEVRPFGSTFYIVAKYVEGDNLRDYASSRQLAYPAIAELCARTGDALQHAHDEGVVHRDLKPANIIVGPDGLPHIIDFGLAKFASADRDLTMNGELLGTPAYMSPELASGHGANADNRTDVYSLGVILYELLTGRCPFDGNRGLVITKILTCDPVPPRTLRATIPRDLETICLKAIDKLPENRYATAREFSEDLRRFTAGEPIRARRVAITEKCWRWIRRHPVISVSTALVVATIVVASATIVSLRQENQRLEGFRPVRITTTPSGARVTLVPIDPKTNELSTDPEDVIRPSGMTPLITKMKPGKYFVEAVLPGGDAPDFVEVYRTVTDSDRVSDLTKRANVRAGLDPDLCCFRDMVIESQRELIKGMVAIIIDKDLRRKNPSLPAMLYVDRYQTTAGDGLNGNSALEKLLSLTTDGIPFIKYPSAVTWTELNQKRLPSAVEYDAIVAAVELGEARSVETRAPVEMGDLFDDFPEFSATIKTIASKNGNAVEKHFREMRVLKGFKNLRTTSELITWADGTVLAAVDSKSPNISIRGVRSATPRFVKP